MTTIYWAEISADVKCYEYCENDRNYHWTYTSWKFNYETGD